MLFSINAGINYYVIKQAISKCQLITKTFEIWYLTQHYYAPPHLFTMDVVNIKHIIKFIVTGYL